MDTNENVLEWCNQTAQLAANLVLALLSCPYVL